MIPSEVTEFLQEAIPARLPVLLTGPPGVGKTSLVRQACETVRYNLIISHPVVSDPTDVKGLPWPDAASGTARFLPIGEYADVLAAEKPTVWFIDDLGQAPAAVQASYMRALLGDGLPDCVTILAATNRRQDRAGVQGILEPVKSRFTTILEVEPNILDWSEWAITAGTVPAELIAFLRFRADLLCDPKPSTDMTNTPNPRTWKNLADLYNLQIPARLALPAFRGAVGEGAAVEFIAFLQVYHSLTSVDHILLDPMVPALPERPDQLFALATALAARATDQTYGRIAQFCERLQKTGHGEFAVLCVRDCLRRCAALAHTPEHTRVVSGPLGRLIAGDVR